MENTARIYNIAYQVRFWFDLLLLMIAFVLVASAPRARDKPWLLIMLLALVLAPLAWYARDLLTRVGAFRTSDAVAAATAVLLNLMSVASTATIVVFAIAWRSKAPPSASGSSV